MTIQVADAFTLIAFLFDAALVATAGWLLVRGLNRNARGMVEGGLSWLLACILVVAVSGALLGEYGGFGPTGFMGAHALVLGLVVLARRRVIESDKVALLALLRNAVREIQPGGPARWLLLLLVVVVLGLGLLAAAGEPLVYDALTYRLPRIAQWLQDGHVGVVNFDDQRLNYMANGQDLVVAWLVGAFAHGYRFTALAQVAGGVLLVGATIGIGRHSGLGKFAAVAAALMTFGFANLAPQWTSAHNDLFAAGVFAAGFFLFWMALQRGEGSVLAGVAIAFALEAKGTTFYALPSAAGWVLWLAWRLRPPARAWLGTIIAGAIGVGIFLGPPFLRNEHHFGHLTAPDEALQEHYGPPFSLAAHVEKLELNLRTATAQLLDPYSQPWGVRDLTAPLATRIAESLPGHDPFSFEDLDRRENVLYFLRAGAPNADFASFGVVPLILLFVGMIVDVATHRKRGDWSLVWGAGVILFLLVENALLQWHPWEFRYSIIVAPWLAVVAARGVEAFPPIGRTVLWAFLLASGFGILGETTFLGDQVGWHAWSLPQENRALGQRWRDWARGLAQDEPNLRVALGTDRPIAWLSRLGPDATTRLESLKALRAKSAEEAGASDGSWLVVPALHFAGHEGRVIGRTFLDRGDAANDLSLAAYRPLQKGESPVPIVYRNVLRPTATGFRCELRLRSWSGRVILKWAVPPGSGWRFTSRSGTTTLEGELRPAEVSLVEVPTSDHELTELTIDLVPADRVQAGGPPPVVVAILPVSS